MCQPFGPQCRVSLPEPRELSGKRHSVVSRRKEMQDVQTKSITKTDISVNGHLDCQIYQFFLSPPLTCPSGHMSPC